MPDDFDLDAIEARADAASPGPWHVDGPWWHDDDQPTAEDMVSGVDRIAIAVPASPYHERGDISTDMQFIAHAREDVPALVAEVRRLRALEAGLTEERRTLEDGWAMQSVAADGSITSDSRPGTVQRRLVTPWERVE